PDDVWQDLSPIEWLARSRAYGLGMMCTDMWLIPRSVAISAGPWAIDLSLMDDSEYFTRVLLSSKSVLFCAGARCYYRSGIAKSLSRRNSRAAWKSQFRVTERCE